MSQQSESLVLASSAADAQAAEAVEQHHAQLAGMLAVRVESLVAAAARGDQTSAEAARGDLVRWAEHELVSHALAEEKALYPAAQAMPEGRLLGEGMLAEHKIITGLVERLRSATDPVRAAAAGAALQAIFDSHLAKENELMLPLLVSAPGVSVAGLLGGMHELLGGHDEHASDEGSRGCGGSCTCGEDDDSGHPELDARAVPHAIRHATIFGALDAVRPGGGLVLIAPHDPLPLLAQIEQRSPGAFDVSYLERGPESWRLQFVSRATD